MPEARELTETSSQFMTVQSTSLEYALHRAFLTAILITGSAERAEAVLTRTLAAWDSAERLEELLLPNTIVAAVCEPEGSAVPLGGEDVESALLMLPPELGGVLRLPPRLRMCFVLRVLLEISRQACARLLDLSVHRVDRYTCEALGRLPVFQSRPAQTGVSIVIRIRENMRLTG